jgi:hypothetical protein
LPPVLLAGGATGVVMSLQMREATMTRVLHDEPAFSIGRIRWKAIGD